MDSTASTIQHPKFLYMPPRSPAGPVGQGHGVLTAPGMQSDPRQSNKAEIFGFGVCEIVMGVLSILSTIIPLSITGKEFASYRDRRPYDYYYYYTPYTAGFTYASSGIWGGIFVITTGILAVRIKSNPSRCMYIANMTMAIITACATSSSTIISGIAAAYSVYSSALIALHVIIALLNFASMVIAIVHAAFCCRGVCCKKDSRSTQPIMYIPTPSSVPYPSPTQPQYVQGPSGQVMLAYVQPVPAHAYPQSSTPIHVANMQQQVNNLPPEITHPVM